MFHIFDISESAKQSLAGATLYVATASRLVGAGSFPGRSAVELESIGNDLQLQLC